MANMMMSMATMTNARNLSVAIRRPIWMFTQSLMQ